MNRFSEQVRHNRHLRYRRALVLYLAILVGGCAVTPNEPNRDDPLIGQIFDTRSGDNIDYETLLDRAAAADVLYLGENHDNADHHAIQKQVIEALVARGLKPAVGFEFFDVGQTAYLEQYVSGRSSTMRLHKGSGKTSPERRLRRQLGWQDRDDRDWQAYFQLLDLAKTHGLPVFGADLAQGLKLRISRSGVTELNPVETHQLIQIPYEEPGYRELMYGKFRDGHCGWGDEPLLNRLYQTWNARNNRMARSIVQMSSASDWSPVVMILGNGHTEHNRGVYGRVKYLNPELQQFNVALQAISKEWSPLVDYLQETTIADTNFGPRHEVLWFTRRHDYTDPCAQL